MKTVKIKFVGKYAEDLQPKDNAITYYLQKNGYDVQISDDADYITAMCLIQSMTTANIPRSGYLNVAKTMCRISI